MLLAQFLAKIERDIDRARRDQDDLRAKVMHESLADKAVPGAGLEIRVAGREFRLCGHHSVSLLSLPAGAPGRRVAAPDLGRGP